MTSESASVHTYRTLLDCLIKIIHLVNSEDKLADILSQLVYVVCTHMSWDLGGIMAIDERAGYSLLVARYDPSPESSRDRRTSWELPTSPVRLVATEHRPLVIKDAQESRDFPGYQEDAMIRGYRTVVILPLDVLDEQGRPLVLSLQARVVREVTSEDLAFLTAVVELASTAVRSAQQFKAERLLASRLQQILAVHSALMKQILDGNSMRHILTTIEDAIGKPLVLVDATRNVLVAGRSPCPETIPDREWKQLISRQTGHALLQRLIDLEPGDFDRTTAIDLSPLGVDAVFNAILEPLTIGGQLVGGMIIFGDLQDFDDFDRMLADEARFALATHMLREYTKFQIESNLQADFMRRLFSKDWDSDEELLMRAGYLGINLRHPAVLLLITLDNLQPQEKYKHMLTYLHRWLSRSVEQIWPDAKIIEDSINLIIFAPLTRPISFVSTLANHLVREINALVNKQPIIIIGPVCEDIHEYQNAYHVLHRAAELCINLQKRGVIHSKELSPYLWIVSSMHASNRQRFIDQMIGPLFSYDAKHKTNLVATLREFLANNCRLQYTANQLGIHVSTLRYRLERIQQVTGWDLDDPEIRFSLDLALRLHSLTA